MKGTVAPPSSNSTAALTWAGRTFSSAAICIRILFKRVPYKEKKRLARRSGGAVCHRDSRPLQPGLQRGGIVALFVTRGVKQGHGAVLHVALQLRGGVLGARARQFLGIGRQEFLPGRRIG